MSIAAANKASVQQQTDFLPLQGTDYVEFYVGNAKQAAHYYQSAFGFQLTAYRGPETGVRDRVSYLLTQNKIRFVLTSPLGPDGDIADHVRERGAVSAYEPRVLRDDDGEIVVAAIRMYGDTIHSLVERRNYNGTFFPGFQ